MPQHMRGGRWDCCTSTDPGCFLWVSRQALPFACTLWTARPVANLSTSPFMLWSNTTLRPAPILCCLLESAAFINNRVRSLCFCRLQLRVIPVALDVCGLFNFLPFSHFLFSVCHGRCRPQHLCMQHQRFTWVYILVRWSKPVFLCVCFFNLLFISLYFCC